MKKTMKKYLAMLLAMVMVLCASCAESNVQVVINEDGTCSVSVEELYEKESVDVIVNAVTNYMIMIYGAEEGAAHAEEITKVLEEYEQVNVDGKEYLKKVTEQTYQTCEEAIAYLEEQVGVGSVSLDTDHFYGAVNVNYAKESGLGSTGEALDTYEDMFLQMGLTREQVQEMIDNSITKISIAFPSAVTYSNGVVDGNVVSWQYTVKDLEEFQNEIMVMYAETDAESKIVNDTQAPEITGIKNNAYVKKVPSYEISDNVEVAIILLNGMEYKKYEGVSGCQEGENTLVVYDYSENKTELTFTYDKVKPTVKGVANGKTYKNARTIKFSDTYGIKKATLNGKTIKSGKKVSKKGSYTLKVTDKAGNVTKIKFKIKK
ncbi:MAG: hypothetical protein II992_11475 [Lachnospiraceae bacterium]|nr:hypothetical protein [Lachnospiraceae bacterium]